MENDFIFIYVFLKPRFPKSQYKLDLNILKYILVLVNNMICGVQGFRISKKGQILSISYPKNDIIIYTLKPKITLRNIEKIANLF